MGFEDTINEIRANGKRALIVGLGISGVECARFLSRRGVRVVVAEKQDEATFQKKSKFLPHLSLLRDLGVEVRFGIDGERVAPVLTDVGIVVLSPGVPLESAVVGTIKRMKVPYVSELELGIELHGGKSIVVTGSNGKSTTVSLIDHLLRHAGIRSYLCGNVGTPVISNEELLAEKEGERSVLVVEASSYQLEACTVLKPAITVVLNVSENHLERHGSMERYAAAKARVMRLQEGNDLVVVNADDPLVLEMARGSRARVGVFGAKSEEELRKISSRWARITPQGVIVLSFNGEVEEYLTDTAQLLGLHNRYNMAAAIMVARAMGIEQHVVQSGLASFLPLEHRLEIVRREGRRVVVNDSKSTTVAASVAALTTILEHYTQEKVVLLLGGLSKAGSWNPLLSRIAKEPRGKVPVICFGKDGPLIASHCRSAGIDHSIAPNLRAATEAGRNAIDDGGVLLLSPGCASFDEFTDFEHRGGEFKRYVSELFTSL